MTVYDIFFPTFLDKRNLYVIYRVVGAALRPRFQVVVKMLL